jgi:hypothetical protein
MKVPDHERSLMANIHLADTLGELGGDDVCARCGRFTPSAVLDPATGESPRVAQGWVSFQVWTLVVDVPWVDDFMLPNDVVEAIRRFDGPIRCERLGPEVTSASVRQVHSELLGNICSECRDELGWSDVEWFAWFALRSGDEENTTQA